MKQKITNLTELVDGLTQKNIKFYVFHANKYFFVDAHFLRKKSLYELEAIIKMNQLSYELLN